MRKSLLFVFTLLLTACAPAAQEVVIPTLMQLPTVTPTHLIDALNGTTSFEITFSTTTNVPTSTTRATVTTPPTITDVPTNTNIPRTATTIPPTMTIVRTATIVPTITNRPPTTTNTPVIMLSSAGTFTLDAVFTSPDNRFSLRYPSGWLTGEYDQVSSGGTINISSDADVFDYSEGVAVIPFLQPNQRRITFGLTDEPQATLALVVGFLENQVTALGLTFDPLETTLNGYEARVVSIVTPEITSLVYVVDFAPSEAIGFIGVIGTPGSLDSVPEGGTPSVRALADAVLESITLLP